MYMYMYWQQKIEKNVSIIVYVNIYYEKNTTAVDAMAKIRLVSITHQIKTLATIICDISTIIRDIYNTSVTVVVLSLLVLSFG